MFWKYFQGTELREVRQAIAMPCAVGTAGSRRTGSRGFALKIFLLNAIGFCFLGLASAHLSHAETLDSKRPPEYFSSHLSSSTSLKKAPVVICGEECFSRNTVLAKRTKRKLSARKISDSSNSRPDLELNTDYFLNIFSDTKYILLSPLGWKSADWLKASLALGVTGVFFALDDEIQNLIQNNRNEI